MNNDSSKPDNSIEPVPLRARRDGWTAERQIAFIEALAETGIVDEACRRVGMSDTAAYKLRMSPRGSLFRQAWEAALDYSLHRLEEDAFVRSREGVARPIFYKGEQVGEWRHFDERLTMFLLRTRRPDRYGKWIERMFAPEPDEDDAADPAIRLEGGIDAIEWGSGGYVDIEEDEGPSEARDDANKGEAEGA